MRRERQVQEGLVLFGMEWAQLRYRKIVPGTLLIETIPSGGSFVEGQDYEADYENGLIKRMENSTLPDWCKNVFYGVEDFDHTKVDAYENQSFTVFVSYEYLTEEPEMLHTHLLGKLCPKFWDKLTSGKPVTYVVYGDSISTGAESTLPEHTYYARFVEALREYVPEAQITCINKALGGEESRGGVKRLDEAFAELNPDLISISYGMNDQNKGDETPHFVEPEEYERNIRSIITALKERTGADILLITPCKPNPKWHWTSGDMDIYAQCMRDIAEEQNLLLADTTALWQQELDHGKSPESLLHNNINHPNDYGHSIYAKALCVHI